MQFFEIKLVIASFDKIFSADLTLLYWCFIVKLRQGSGKDRQGMALKAKGLKP